MPRKAGTIIRVGVPGYQSAHALFRKVVADGWDSIGVPAALAPKRVSLGSVVAVVLLRARGTIK